MPWMRCRAASGSTMLHDPETMMNFAVRPDSPIFARFFCPIFLDCFFSRVYDLHRILGLLQAVLLIAGLL